MQHEMLLLKIYYLQMILGNLLLQIVVHLKEFPIVQWGLTNNGKEGVSFPIVFKNVYALTMGNLNNTSWSPHFRDVTTTGFKATVEGTGYSYHGYWIALGN